MSLQTLRFRVIDRVQGVGFRAYVRTRALEMGATGVVANCPDGSVQGTITLSEGLLPFFQEALRTGPPGARVDALEIEAADPCPGGVGEGFRIEKDCL